MLLRQRQGEGELLEVISTSYVRRAFNRRSRGNLRKQRCFVVGSELVVPISVADVRVPDARLAPEYLRGIEGQPPIFEDFGLRFVIVEGASRAAAAECCAVRSRNPGALWTGHVENIDDGDGRSRNRLGNEAEQLPGPLEVTVSAERTAPDAGTSAQAGCRTLCIAKACRPARVERVITPFLVGRDADIDRAGQVQRELEAGRDLRGFFGQEVILHAAGEVEHQGDIFRQEGAERLAAA